MRLPRFRLRTLMIAVAVSAGVIAESRQRRERLAQLCNACHERADAYFDRTGRVCKYGQTRQSIEDFYRRQGPTVWLDYQTGLYYGTLSYKYDIAANRRWLPGLFDLPPFGGFKNFRALGEWGLETVLEATPLLGIVILSVIVRAESRPRLSLPLKLSPPK